MIITKWMETLLQKKKKKKKKAKILLRICHLTNCSPYPSLLLLHKHVVTSSPDLFLFYFREVYTTTTPRKRMQQRLSFTPPTSAERSQYRTPATSPTSAQRSQYFTRSTGTLQDVDALPPPKSEIAKKVEKKSAFTALMTQRQGNIS